MQVVYFAKTNHQYKSDSNEYMPVSGLWKPYFSEFDNMSISIKKAFKELDKKSYEYIKKQVGYYDDSFIEKILNYSNVPHSEIHELAGSYRQEWVDKANKGTEFHSKMENEDLINNGRINPFTNEFSNIVKWDIPHGYENMSCPYNVSEIEDGYIPEMLVKDDKHLIAGQIDQCFISTIDGIRYVDIDDWKTDKEIELKPSFFNPSKGGFAKMSFPVNHIYETNYWKYTMKISTYAYFLELDGFTIRNLSFTHVNINDELEIVGQKRYIIPYKKEEVKNILKKRLITLCE